jgi:diadenosine tetraphosphate (Ap4A) HIT family hydrolase
MLELTCPFCLFLEEGSSPNWRALFGNNSAGESILTSENHSILYDTSPVVEGHVLLVTNEHYPSTAAVPATVRQELQEILERAITAVEAAYGEVTIFEHGAASSVHNAGACVDHAHLHLVPGNHDLRNQIRQDYPDLRSYLNWDSLAGSLENQPYVATQLPGGEIHAAYAPACATQYLRRLLAGSVGATERWNWRDCMRWRDKSQIIRDIEEARTKLTELTGLI